MSYIFYILHICVNQIYYKNNIKNIRSRKTKIYISKNRFNKPKLIWEKRKKK